jgi:hypothetical protein
MQKFVLLLIVFSFTCSSYGQQKTSALDFIENLKNGAAIVRLYVNKPKMDMLQKSINDARTPESEKKALEKILADHQMDRELYVKHVIKAFKENYTFSKVYFMYDYDQKKLKDGVRSGIFLDANGKLDSSIELEEQHFLIFGRGNNDETILISQLNGEPLPSEFPTSYKRSIFNFFSYVFSTDKLSDYVKKLNDKLKKFYVKRLMAQ